MERKSLDAGIFLQLNKRHAVRLVMAGIDIQQAALDIGAVRDIKNAPQFYTGRNGQCSIEPIIAAGNKYQAAAVCLRRRQGAGKCRRIVGHPVRRRIVRRIGHDIQVVLRRHITG